MADDAVTDVSPALCTDIAAGDDADAYWSDAPLEGLIDSRASLVREGCPSPTAPVREGLWCRPVAVESVVRRLDRAWHTLVPDGLLWVPGPWAEDRYRGGYTGLMDRSYFVQLAERCGFECVESTRPDVICLRRQETVRWRIGAMRDEDFPAVAALFEAVFGHGTTGALWRWKYGHGRGQNIVCWSAGEPVAHYGGLSRAILYRGMPAMACQIADVMVHPRERGVLSRRGAFFRIAASQSEASRGPHRVGYGFPNARHMAVAGRLGLYEPVGRLVELRWMPHAGRASLRWAFRSLPAEARVGRQFEELWSAMAARLPEALIGVRDGAWLDYRYREHPHNVYAIHQIAHRVTGRAVALAVTREVDDRLELADFIGDPIHLGVVMHLVRRYCHARGLRQVFCWFSAGHLAWFQPSHPVVEELDVIIPTSVWTEDAGPAELTDRWWLMGGDTDFR